MSNTRVLKAIRAECLACMDGHYSLIKDCQAQKSCLLWPFRLGSLPEDAGIAPLEAIREHCLECAGSLQGVYACRMIKFNQKPCSLHPLRFGVLPPRRKSAPKAPDTQLAFKDFKQD